DDDPRRLRGSLILPSHLFPALQPRSLLLLRPDAPRHTRDKTFARGGWSEPDGLIQSVKRTRQAFGGDRRRSGAIVRASLPRVRAHHASTLGYDPGFSSTQKRNARTRKSAA